LSARKVALPAIPSVRAGAGKLTIWQGNCGLGDEELPPVRPADMEDRPKFAASPVDLGWLPANPGE
jgi:hypothetical protein